jgi:hypothetical protein
MVLQTSRRDVGGAAAHVTDATRGDARAEDAAFQEARGVCGDRTGLRGARVGVRSERGGLRGERSVCAAERVA